MVSGGFWPWNNDNSQCKNYSCLRITFFMCTFWRCIQRWVITGWRLLWVTFVESCCLRKSHLTRCRLCEGQWSLTGSIYCNCTDFHSFHCCSPHSRPCVSLHVVCCDRVEPFWPIISITKQHYYVLRDYFEQVCNLRTAFYVVTTGFWGSLSLVKMSTVRACLCVRVLQ